MAKLYFHYATMNAGKSTMLLQASYNYRERGMSAMLFVAGHYRKEDGGYISSRIGLESDAEMFRDGDDLYARVAEHHGHTNVHCVFVDEAQFLEEEQVWQLARVADRLGIPVMCYGLRTDFQGNLFTGSQALLALADELREVRTICRCGRKATMVVRLGPDGKVARKGAQVAIGKDVYVSLCRKHWEEEMGRWKAEDLVSFAGSAAG
ncbi:thymidine kinase [Nitratireductor sp. GZWM139]|uniref:thymidine kinase n=1 Tax=Nitratireductor sp. GZWM139 TaxID=2950541 RepID=UPI0024BEC5EB|nr:thymidine kinase [Nitratireductor sp. GZWM139]MDJ1462387.1 thymidine kinase [Nitratireductor sp. GZWM139]